ncbi:MAG: class I SAM-dependent RNA methyltransferase [Proteobacteria bacterium]|nr:class I SAM-dependent RNA methyltransferase [Pseudomonadota bacterium]
MDSEAPSNLARRGGDGRRGGGPMDGPGRTGNQDQVSRYLGDDPENDGEPAPPPVRRRTLEDPYEVDLALHGVSHGGEAVGRVDGQIAFISGALPEEKVHALITERKPAYLRGLTLSVTAASPDRTEPPCPHFGLCGGCHWQHADYEAQLRYKTQVLRDQLRRLAGIDDPPMVPAVGSPNPWNYRNSVQLVPGFGPKGERSLNYQVAHAQGMVPIDVCAIASKDINRAIEIMPWALIPEETWERLDAIILRHAPPIPGMPMVATRLREMAPKPIQGRTMPPGPVRDEQGIGYGIQVTVVCRSPVSKRDMRAFVDATVKSVPDLAAIMVARGRHDRGTLLWGFPTLAYEMGGQILAVPPGAFFQVNLGAADRLVARVREWLAPTKTSQIIDAYSGVGVFALNLAPFAGAVVAIESDESAVAGAYDNVAALGHTNVAIHHEPVEAALPRLAKGSSVPDRSVILDPPRRGVEPAVLDALATLAPDRIVYVSCEPSTLSRDLKRLIASGYRLTRTGVIDIFPQTYHLESVSLLERVDGPVPAPAAAD